MQWLRLLLFVAVSHADVLLTKSMNETDSVISAPVLISLTAVDPTGFILRWEPVKSDIENPILGYKVKIWKQPSEKIYKYEKLNGVKVLVEKDTASKFPLEIQEPDFDPVDVIITPPEELQAKGENMTVGLTYEFRVQAFTKNGDGPLSAPMRLKYSLPNGVHDFKQDSTTLSNTSESNSDINSS